MAEPFDRLSEESKSRRRRAAQPRWTQPMLATLTHDPFSDPDWMFERKLDGQRCLAFVRRGRVTLRSRNRKPLNDTYPEIVDAIESTDSTACILDGEMVAFAGGVTSFSRLQQRLGVKDVDRARASGVAVRYYVFDLLHLDGWDLTRVPLRDRKRLLKGSRPFGDPVRFTPHRNEAGESYFADACRKGWEGILAKRADGGYTHGRSRDWLKFKCSKGQEFVIGGYTDPQGDRRGFGAILVGFHRDGDLVYAGKIGTGFDDDRLRDLGSRMKSMERPSSPFDVGKLPSSGVHWIRPELVAEVAFSEWTRENRLRHPRFLGLRDDKDPKDVVREE